MFQICCRGGLGCGLSLFAHGFNIELPGSDEESYIIVGSAEADPLEAKISNDSPIAKAIIGKKLGDVVTVETPGGSFDLKITKIEKN